MDFIYVFPTDKFDCTVTNDELKNAYRKKERVERYTVDEFVNAVDNYKQMLFNCGVRKIPDNENSYSISCLSIEDLQHAGFDTANVTESDMLRLVDKLSDDYCEQLFWNSLKTHADSIGIPRRNENEENDDMIVHNQNIINKQ